MLNLLRVSDIDISSHATSFKKAQQQFKKLGAVNLAASEEYEEVSKRFEEDYVWCWEGID